MSSEQHNQSNYFQVPAKNVTANGVSYAYRELGAQGRGGSGGFPHSSCREHGQLGPAHHRSHRRKTSRDYLQQPRCGGASTGRVPDSIEGMADDAATFIKALGYPKVDLFGFSLGGMIAQSLVIKHPGLVRKLVLAGTGPAGGEGIQKIIGTTYYDILRGGTLTRQDPKEFLFFNRNSAGKPAARAFIERLKERTTNREAPVKLQAFQTQLKAIRRWGGLSPSADLGVITQPTLIANGDNDRMVPSVLSSDMRRRIPGSELVIYPDSGHGGIFQFHDRFVPVALEFLGR